jgi:hypothetical protein
MTLVGLRSSTRDVDTLTSLDRPIRDAVSAVAVAHGLPAGWLNSDARSWAPEGLTLADCTLLLDHEHLSVLGPPADAVFLMKLNFPSPRSRGLDGAVDAHDVHRSENVVRRFHLAYPNEGSGPYLAEWVQRIIDAASRS